MGWFKNLFAKAAPEDNLTRIAMNALGNENPHTHFGTWTGETMDGGYGTTQITTDDYWTLRERSVELWKTNLYARGIIRRFVTNVISSGLKLEAIPEALILGIPRDNLEDWSEETETRFELWADQAILCDFYGKHSFDELQQIAYAESLISGDVLIRLRIGKRSSLPMIEIVTGGLVQTPPFHTELKKGHRIDEGVEYDARNIEVAFYIVQANGTTYDRIEKYGKKSNRLQAWLMHGTDNRFGDSRGQPFLAVLLQSIKELMRYKDSAQRKAIINSFVTMFIKKEQQLMSTKPMSGGATRNDSSVVTDSNGDKRKFNIANMGAGIVMEELQVGETPVAFGHDGTDINFPLFEKTMLDAWAWCLEAPPTVMKMSFTANYSASQAEINEFNMYLEKRRGLFGKQFTGHVYADWLWHSVNLGVIEARGFVKASLNIFKEHDVYGSWIKATWLGAMKPSSDQVKLVKSLETAVDRMWMTNDRAARVYNGSKFSRNVARAKRENEKIVEAKQPIVDAEIKTDLATAPKQGAPPKSNITKAEVKALIEANVEVIDAHIESALEGFDALAGITIGDDGQSVQS